MPGGNYNVPPKVSYGYGLGDNTKPTGPAPNYSFADGLSTDVPVNAGPKPRISYAYGADGLTSDTVAMSPQAQPQTQVAAPATAHPAANSNHI